MKNRDERERISRRTKVRERDREEDSKERD